MDFYIDFWVLHKIIIAFTSSNYNSNSQNCDITNFKLPKQKNKNMGLIMQKMKNY